MSEQKTEELASINEQLSTLRDQMSKTNDEIYKHIEKRDKLNEQARTLRQEISELKKERDSLNESVKTLKQQRDELRENNRPLIEEIKGHSKKIRELKEKRSGEPRHQMQKEFDAIEWKIQTTSLDLQEEKRLIEIVRDLETQLNVYKKIDQHSKRISELKTELDVFQEKAERLHQELTANAQKSQELHAKMQTKFDELKKIVDEASGSHAMYIQAKEQVRPIHEEMAKLMEQKRTLQDVIREVREETQKLKLTKEQDLKEKLGSEARVKLERGEKLNWQEFQLLAGDESETED